VTFGVRLISVFVILLAYVWYSLVTRLKFAVSNRYTLLRTLGFSNRFSVSDVCYI
jgi:hypothetical protein